MCTLFINVNISNFTHCTNTTKRSESIKQIIDVKISSLKSQTFMVVVNLLM